MRSVRPAPTSWVRGVDRCLVRLVVDDEDRDFVETVLDLLEVGDELAEDGLVLLHDRSVQRSVQVGGIVKRPVGFAFLEFEARRCPERDSVVVGAGGEPDDVEDSGSTESAVSMNLRPVLVVSSS